MNEKGPFFLRVYVHVIKQTNCTGGQSLARVQEALSKLDAAYNPHGIFFIWDCQILPICDDTYFFTSSNDVFDEGYEHTDGIDIFLFPDAEGIPGGGIARSILSTSFLIYGNSDYFPNDPLVNSHVVSHEMGHCLGLLHTHHVDGVPSTGRETVDQIGIDGANIGNCLIAGDCVCDTPADPNIRDEVNPFTCEYIGSATDSNSGDAYYDPNTDNIMSYTRMVCQTDDGITAGQGKRARNIIATESILQNCLVKELIITNTTWDLSTYPSGVIEIFGNLEVDPNATLTIGPGMTIRFSRSGKAIIKPNGTLKLQGATLTNNPCSLACSPVGYCGDTWGGIELWGNSDKHQFQENGEYFHGKLLADNAVIENAEVAVRGYGPDIHTQSGGIIHCVKSTFKNNLVGIDLTTFENFYPPTSIMPAPGTPTGYRALFSKCSFVTDVNYPHIENFGAFVSLREVINPIFRGCDFSVVSDYTPPVPQYIISDYGYGIYADHAKYSLLPFCESQTAPCSSFTRSSMEGLGYGVYSFGMFTNSQPFVIRQADFKDCYVGVFSRLVGGNIILNSSFSLGNVHDPSITDAQIGVAFESDAMGLTLQENTFTGSDNPTSFRTIGISMFKIGTVTQEIRRNTFQKLDIGNQAFGSNGDATTGLYYTCNINQENKIFDFLVCDSGFTNSDRIRKNQGVLNDLNGYDATGNVFSNTGTATDRDFANRGTQNILYHYFNGNNAEAPDEYSGFDSDISAEKNDCEVEYCAPPCNISSLSAYVTATGLLQDSAQTALENYEFFVQNGTVGEQESALELLALKRQKLDEAVHQLYVNKLHDTTRHEQYQEIDVLSFSENYGVKLKRGLANYAAGENSTGNDIIAAAQAEWSSVEGIEQIQQTDLGSFQSVLTASNERMLDNSQIEYLLNLTDGSSTNGYLEGAAKNILTRYGYHFVPATCIPDGKADDEKAISALSQDDERIISSIYPNPAVEKVNFNFSIEKNEVNQRVSIFSVAGKKVKELELYYGRGVWNTNNVIPGIYFYRVYNDQQLITQGKIVIKKQ